MNTPKVRWGILGCAHIAEKSLIPGLLEADNAVLQAVASRDAAKLTDFSKRFKPKTGHVGYEALLADPEVEAVYIPLPNHLHKEWVLKAAAAGKHVLCEKPLGLNEAEVREMHEACAKAGVVLMEAFAYRHSPLTLEVKRLIDQGAIGELRYIEAGFSFFLGDPANVRQFKDMGGGATYDIGCYSLDVIRYLAGQDPVAIHAQGELHPQSGIDLGSSVLLRFPGKLRAYSWCSFDASFRADYLVVGSTGRIRVPSCFNEKGKLEILLRQDGAGKEKAVKVKTPDNYRLEVEQLGRCIRQGEKPLVDAASSLATARLIDEVLRQIGY